MPRLRHMIVDSLALLMVGVSLTSVVVSYERNLPSPATEIAQAFEADQGWMDPLTTGSITPKAREAAANKVLTNSKMEKSIQSSNAGSKAWVDPPRR